MYKRVAFLGPKGTYAEQAALALAKLEKIEQPKLIPCSGLRSVVEHVANQICEAGVVPIENSVEGGVTATLDALWSFPQICIHRAIVLPIRHALVGSGQIEDISEVLSHPQALAQCSEWLKNNLPNALHLPTSSTAEAARMVTGSHFRAAIASRSAKYLRDLKELAFPINDVAGNCTRFLLLKNGDRKATGNIASLAFSLHSNSPGALLEALSLIANLGLNMSRIESRPSKRELGEYVFFIDVEVPENSEKIANKITGSLEPLCEHIINFGIYESSEISDQKLNLLS